MPSASTLISGATETPNAQPLPSSKQPPSYLKQSSKLLGLKKSKYSAICKTKILANSSRKKNQNIHLYIKYKFLPLLPLFRNCVFYVQVISKYKNVGSIFWTYNENILCMFCKWQGQLLLADPREHRVESRVSLCKAARTEIQLYRLHS